MLLSDLLLVHKQRMLAVISTNYLEGGEGLILVLKHGPCESPPRGMLVLPVSVNQFWIDVSDLPGHGSLCLLRCVIHPDAVPLYNA